MNSIVTEQEDTLTTRQKRRDIAGEKQLILGEIYRDENNIAIWQRELDAPLLLAVQTLLETVPTLQASIVVSPENVSEKLITFLGDEDIVQPLRNDVTTLVDMFCLLFDQKRAGLRITALSRAMCPRFHVDRVPCRLVTTYYGVATEWLPDYALDRTKLGTGNQGKPDDQSGVYVSGNDIQRLACGDVALLKGELWEGNENGGLVHRSPQVPDQNHRLLVTIDFVDG